MYPAARSRDLDPLVLLHLLTLGWKSHGICHMSIPRSCNTLPEQQPYLLVLTAFRLKPEMWGTLAAELGIPWRAAEAMHWQLGEADMARRAGVVPFSLASTSGSSTLPHGPSGMQPSGISPGGLQPSPSGIIGYGAEGSHSRGSSVYTAERIGPPRSGYVGGGESSGRLGRRSGERGMREIHSPGTSSRSGGGSESAGGSGILLPSLAEMERGMTALTGGPGQMEGPQTGPGPGLGPGQGLGGGRGGHGEEERR